MPKDLWYIDSACLNHVTRDKEKFKNLDEKVKSQVLLGDDNQVQIEGKGTVVVEIQGKEKFIQNVHYALNLAHNLLSVGQLIRSGFTVIFKDDECMVEKKIGEVLLKSTITENNMFPIDFSNTSIYGLMSSR